MALIPVGCQPAGNGPLTMDTADPANPNPTQTLLTEPTSTRIPIPTAVVTQPPAVVLPDSSGLTIACESNTLLVPVIADTTNSAAAPAVSIAAAGGRVYVVANAGLYAAEQAVVDAGVAAFEPVLLPGVRIGDRVVQELVDMAPDIKGEQLYLLDKAGSLYSLDLSSSQTSLVYRAAPDDQAEVYPQMVAVTVDHENRPVLLDTAHGALWTLYNPGLLEFIYQDEGLMTAVDLAASGGRYHALLRDGSTEVIREGRWPLFREAEEAPGLALSIGASDHLGVDAVFTVDAFHREIALFDQVTGEPISRYVFGFSTPGLLRAAVFSNGRLYALFEGEVVVFPGPEREDAAACAPPSPASIPRPWLYGLDIIAMLRGWRFPIEGGTLPIW
nr:hypothetical protein [Anaerolineae bacterium]